MAIPRSELAKLYAPDAFLWATGIEDTFITAPWPATGRTLDEYELTRHYDCWREDIDLMAELGVRTARYGVPWHRIQPEPGRWDWSWADQALEYLLERGIDPIVDLVHYGLPSWIEGAYLNPDFPERMAEFASRLAERHRGRIRWYTPLNEPRITAWYCGYLGWWPPFRRGWQGFVAVMRGIARGICRTVEALRDIDPEMVIVHVDATDHYAVRAPELAAEAQRRQEIGFLALDLAAGRITERHALWTWLGGWGFTEADRAWYAEHAVQPDVVGLNMYPMFSQKIVTPTARGTRIRMTYGDSTLVERLVDLYWERYRLPMMISETAARGSVARRRQWLDGSVAAIARLRGRGVPLVGYTWWPMFALVAWAYRQSNRPERDYLEQMGLWDLDPDSEPRLNRLRTPLVDAYQALVRGGAESVGRLAPVASPEARAA